MQYFDVLSYADVSGIEVIRSGKLRQHFNQFKFASIAQWASLKITNRIFAKSSQIICFQHDSRMLLSRIDTKNLLFFESFLIISKKVPHDLISLLPQSNLLIFLKQKVMSNEWWEGEEVERCWCRYSHAVHF